MTSSRTISLLVVTLGLNALIACGGSDKPAEPTPNAAMTSTAPPAATPEPTASPLPTAKPADPVITFGKKAPAAGAKWTDHYKAELKDETREEERKLEVVTSDEKAISKLKVTLTKFDHTFKGKTNTPNKSVTGKVFTVEAKADKPEVMDDAGKPANATGKFVATRRGPRVGQPLVGLAAFPRPLKVGDVVDGDAVGQLVTELTEWKDENGPPPPPTAKKEYQAKATLKAIEKEEATFDVVVKEKLSEGTNFSLEVDHTGTVTVRLSEAMVSKANLTSKGMMKIDMTTNGKKLKMDLPLDATITFARTWN